MQAVLRIRLGIRRLRVLPTVLLALLADHERAVEEGRVAADDARSTGEITGVLTAPVVARAETR